MAEYLLVLASAVFANNIVMVEILGLCPFMGVSKKLEAAIGMGAATAFALALASGSSYLINRYLLGPGLSYSTALSFIVVIAGIVQLTGMVVQKTSPVLYQMVCPTAVLRKKFLACIYPICGAAVGMKAGFLEAPKC